MTREADEASHPAPRRNRVNTAAAVFAVAGAPLAWLAEITAAYAFSSAPCFERGARLTVPLGVQIWPLAISAVFLVVSLAALLLGITLYRRTRRETGGAERRLVQTGSGRTRFLALWGIAFAIIFTALIAVNIVLLLGMPACAS